MSTKKIVYYEGTGTFCIVENEELYELTPQLEDMGFFTLPESCNNNLQYRGHCKTSYLHTLGGGYDLFRLKKEEKYTEAEVKRATKHYNAIQDTSNKIAAPKQAQKTQQVIDAAKNVIVDDPKEIKTKSTNKLIASAIARILDDQEHKYFKNNKAPYSIKIMTEIISDAIKNSLIQ